MLPLLQLTLRELPLMLLGFPRREEPGSDFLELGVLQLSSDPCHFIVQPHSLPVFFSVFPEFGWW